MTSASRVVLPWRHARATAAAWRGPVAILDVDLADDLPTIVPGTGPRGEPHTAAQVLVRRHGVPVGLVEIDLTGGPVRPERLGRQLASELGTVDGTDRHPAADRSSIHLADPTTGEGDARSSLPGDAAGVADRPRPPLVSVVVTTGGEVEDLDRALTAIERGSARDIEVVVVDNRPGNPSARVVVEDHHRMDPRVRYLREPTPGRSRARNTGYLLSRGGIVAFTDPDCVPDAGWVDAIIAAFARNPRAACVTGPVLAAELDTPEQIELDEITRVTGDWQRRTFDLDEHRDPTPSYPFVPRLFGSGVNMSVRKALLPDLWAFDVNLGPGSPGRAADDLDVFIDLLYRGDQIAFEPAALVRQRHPSNAHEARERLRDHDIGTAAMLTKQLVTARGRRRDVVHVLASGQRPRDLTTGPTTYARSRLRNSWTS